MNNKTDFRIAQTQHWYRIPVGPAPFIVKNGEVKYLAFYHTKVFGKDRHSVRWYSKVKNVSVVKRKDLFPQLNDDPKSENEYYKIEFNELRPLPNVITCRRPRRILFIPTTEQKLFNSTEINFLFNDGPLKEKLWLELVKRDIKAERHLTVNYRDLQNFYLDFAIFCKDGKINIEVDSSRNPLPKDFTEDGKRNDCLSSMGWSVLRFTGDDIYNNMYKTMKKVNEAITRLGGMEDEK